MPRVIGIDPGTVSIDLCGLDNGRLFLDRSWPTAEALADPAPFVAELEAAGPLDLVVGPSGYGLPITRVQDITEEALRLAFLAAPGETGGIGGLRNLVRALARTALPVVLTPGVVHLPTVPAHRKVNRVDMGTAEKVCAVAFAVSDQARRLGSPLSNVSLVLLELWRVHGRPSSRGGPDRGRGGGLGRAARVSRRGGARRRGRLSRGRGAQGAAVPGRRGQHRRLGRDDRLARAPCPSDDARGAGRPRRAGRKHPEDGRGARRRRPLAQSIRPLGPTRARRAAAERDPRAARGVRADALARGLRSYGERRRE